MPDPTPPGKPGGSADRPPQPLTPDAIDAALINFRTWLEEMAEGEPAGYPAELGRSATGVFHPPVTDVPGSPAVDLATVVAAFTALRHEVNLQTKAARVQSEQLAKALEALDQTTEDDNDDAATRPFVKAVAEVFDTLTRTTAEIDRLRESIAEAPSLWRKLFGARHNPTVDRLSAAVTGLRMSERRVERLMLDVGLEPVECVGRPFDPETMEAVEAVAGGEHEAGTVVEELRRGYLWNGRVFRYAQVRVAK
jgi:molecular chaperone GrpE